MPSSKRSKPSNLEDFLNAIFDMKTYGLLAVVYAFEKKRERDYVTRAELLKWMKVSPKRARALDVRLKKLLDSGWLETGGARGRYRLSVLARDYILHIGLASRRVLPYFATEKMPTHQVVLKAKLPYVDFMNNEGFFSAIERSLARKEYEMIFREGLSIGVRKSRELELVLIEAMIKAGEIIVKATSGPGHLLKGFFSAFRPGDVLTLPEKESITETDILKSFAFASFLQIYDSLTEVLVGVVEEIPLKGQITSIEKTEKPEFYIFNSHGISRE